VNRKRTIDVPTVMGIRTEQGAYDESNLCDGVGNSDVVRAGRRVFSFFSEDFGTLKALRLSGDAYANSDTYAVTKSFAEHDADTGA